MSTESQIINQSNQSNPNPKTDFYLYVNQKWLDDPKNAIPSDYPKWGGFLQLYDTGLLNQIELVRSLREKTDKTDEEKKISAIWEASVKRFNSWKENTATTDPISRELEILDSYLVPNIPISSNEDLIHRVADYFHYTQINGIGNVFDFDKGSDLQVANNYVLDFSTTGLSLPSREYYLNENFAEKFKDFKQHLTNISQIINSSTGTSLDTDFVQNVIDFETEIAKNKMKEDQTRHYDEYYTGTTLTNLYQKINELNSLKEKQENFPEDKRDFMFSEEQIGLAKIFFERVYELFDFRKILSENRKKSFIDNNVPNPPLEEHLSVFDGDAIRRILCMVFDSSNFMKYRSFLQYKVICTFSGFCTKNLDDEYFDFYGRKLKGQEVQKSEDKQSINLVNAYADEMMGKVFVAKYFPEQYKHDIRSLIQEVLDVMNQSIKSNDWLTEQTKDKALEKLSKFNVKVGYPDIWKDYSDFNVSEGDTLYDVFKKSQSWGLKNDFFNKLNTVLDRNEWGMSPQTVNAYFMPTQNEIVFPAAILQPPFYCKTIEEVDFDFEEEKIKALELVPTADISPWTTLKTLSEEQVMRDLLDASNFGGIVAVIAHEITHGYDDTGRKFDGDGNMTDWWSEEDAKLFESKTQLMLEQADNYTFIDSEDSNKAYKMNIKNTLGENLADLGGLSLSLKAMSCRSKRGPQSLIASICDDTCPEVRKSYRKLIFRVLLKSFANIWRLNIKKALRIDYLTTDPHAPTDFRANLVKNMDEFYESFNITESDPMYIKPAKRLRMW